MNAFEDRNEIRVIGPGFYENVYAVLRLVPAGHLTTYGDIGTMLGSPRVARQVGYALAAIPPGSDLPWHRVINAKGMISFRGDLTRATAQEDRLAAEGLHPSEGGRYDLKKHRWHYPGVPVPYRRIQETTP